MRGRSIEQNGTAAEEWKRKKKNGRTEQKNGAEEWSSIMEQRMEQRMEQTE